MPRWLAIVMAVGCSPPAPALEVERDATPTFETEVAEATVALVESVPSETMLGSEDIDDTHDVWLAMIDGATRAIDVGQFYAAGRPGSDRFDDVVAALERARGRGVKVRVLVDRLFAAEYRQSLEELGRVATVRTTDAWHPGVHHAKYLVVDARDAYLGSANLDWRSLEHIHEIGVRVGSKHVGAELADLFERDWRRAEGAGANWGDARWNVVPLLGGGSLRLVASPEGALPDPTAFELDALIEALSRAEQRAAIQLLDYDAAYRDGRPFVALDAAIREAAGRGVRIRILTSHWQATHMAAVQALHAIENVEVALLTVPPARAGFIPFARVAHAKYAAFDGAWAWIGSSNWKGDYFHTGRNVGVVLEGSPLVAQLEGIFGKLWLSGLAELVDPQRSYPPPRLQ
jgi:phosphatidylserine/phosphatidylglycerophosphate/cardiolipin synthase-like enzyme